MSRLSRDSAQYNDRVAEHYAAYRPPLHQKILSLALPKNRRFQVGLDIGSGTGYSAIALAEYCDSVFGVEPSDAMRESARPHEKVRYLSGHGAAIPLKESSVDIITFAGSLFYINVPTLIPEIQRVCRHKGYVLAYDFEVLLEPVLTELTLTANQQSDGYDHAVNFSSVEILDEIVVRRDQIDLAISADELSHILLASPGRYAALVTTLGRRNLFDNLRKIISGKVGLTSIGINIFYSNYQLKNNESV